MVIHGFPLWSFDSLENGLAESVPLCVDERRPQSASTERSSASVSEVRDPLAAIRVTSPSAVTFSLPSTEADNDAGEVVSVSSYSDMFRGHPSPDSPAPTDLEYM